MDARSPILLIGNSVRYLAQSAGNAGIPVFGVDAFADLDTRLACRVLRRATTITPQALVNAVHTMDLDDSISWVYGAGFEPAPGVLASLGWSKRKGLGNDPRVLQLLAEPRRFFALLAELDIAHPRTSQQRPPDVAGWLFKSSASCGGLGVRHAIGGGDKAASGFYQAFVDGPLCSLLFAADTRDIHVLGFNRLHALDPTAGDFRCGSALSGYRPSGPQQRQMVTAATRLTRALGLRGVNGLDFVLWQGRALLLDLNARPPATLELYENLLPQGGLICHLDACEGRLPATVRPAEGIAGLRVMYASRDLQIGAIEWPSWATDRPAGSARVSAGEPLCTVHARGATAQRVVRQLQQRVAAMRCLINGFSEAAA